VGKNGLVKNVSTRYYYRMSEILIYAAFERLANLIRAEERQLGADNGLQPVHLYALYYLYRCNRFSDTPAALTEYLGMTKGTVSQTVQVLVNRGLIDKQADSEDKRVTHLKLSASGKKIIKNLIPPPLVKSAISELSNKDASDIEQALQKLLFAIQGAGKMKSFGECQTCRFCLKDNEKYECGLTHQPLKLVEIRSICKEHTPP